MSLGGRFTLRVRILTGGLILVGLVFIGRLWTLQVWHGEEYARKADAQLVVLKDPLLNRGKIYFATKEGTEVLAAGLRPPQDASASTTGQKNDRYYPGGALAAHVLGFVAYNNDDERRGRYGLERYYEETLSRPEENLYANFFVELFGGIQDALGDTPRRGDLVSTIEPTVQAELERILAAYGGKWSPATSGGIVMDPETGAIVAMAATPEFDPNAFNVEQDARVFGNPLIENVYEIGSIIKPLTVAAGLDSGVITESTRYDDKGCITLDEKKICNFDGKARGVVPVQEILSQSLNVGASFVSGALGFDTQREYFLERYKLGEETGIDLPGEVHGLVGNLARNSKVEFATASFGQGMALTPIETVRALATLGNGGYLVTPHVVSAVRDESGTLRELGWGEPMPVLKPETSTTISRMLTAVVDGPLADGKIKMEHHSIAAKTGTAQVARPEGGGYYEDRFLHSFFGYFPSFNPTFIVFLFALEPKGAQYASQTWALPFKDMADFLINYYDIPPDR